MQDTPSMEVEGKCPISSKTCEAITKALSKIPAGRFKDAHFFARMLENAKPKAVPAKSKKLLAGLVILVAAIVVQGVWVLRNRSTESRDANPRPFANANTYPFTNWSGVEDEPAFSPDGKRLAFTSDREGNLDIWIRELSNDRAWNLTADSPFRDVSPRWSPDGTRIAFHSEREEGGLFVANLFRNSIRKVFDDGGTAVWSPDGSKLASVTYVTGKKLYVMEADGKNSQLIFNWEQPGQMGIPSWSPDGNWIAFSGGTQQAWNIYIKKVKGEEGFYLTKDTYWNWTPVWARQTNAIYFRSDRGGVNDIWFMQVNLSSMSSAGEAIPITYGVVSCDGIVAVNLHVEMVDLYIEFETGIK